ncbi:MAG: hypothetical protein KatS3mg010_1927 [Acidimicrobiia bacterium]|nr:MAG: hypothetical protein KatS3mg010_1927 [Acidimicrobiia bacterium]
MTDVDLEALDETGPIDFVVVEWPAGREPDGSALPLLLDLVDRRIIRVLDLAFVKKGDDGSVTGVDVSGVGFGDEVDVTVFAAARSGLLGDDDLDEAGRVLDPGASAAVLVYENAWAGPFAAALRRTGAQLVATERIPVQAVLASLDAMDAGD